MPVYHHWRPDEKLPGFWDPTEQERHADFLFDPNTVATHQKQFNEPFNGIFDFGQ